MAMLRERSQAGGPCPAGTRPCCPFYVLHEPVIVAAVWAVARWHAPILEKQVSLVIVPFGGTLGPYERLVRRFYLTQLLFGRKPAPRRTDLRGHTK
jgi:hypothetical protein